MTAGESRILTVNAGSASLRFALFAADSAERPALVRGSMTRLGSTQALCSLAGELAPSRGPQMEGIRDHSSALAALLAWLSQHGLGQQIGITAHRVVHGGARQGAPALITPALLAELETLVPLAPLHQPNDLAAIRALHELLPDCPQLACFDTAFHRSMPARARRLTVPAAAAPDGIERYGFHGLAYEHIAAQMRRDAPAARRIIAAHLGNGASLCALLDGRSMDTTMGLTPLDGLPMGTRSGSVDPGLLLQLLQQGWDAERLGRMLWRESGLLALSGLSSDMRTLLASTEPAARAAVDIFCYHCARQVGALAIALGGLDALVFSGGIGEHAAAVRARIISHCDWLGIRLDETANETHGPLLTTADSPIQARVIRADEEQVLAGHALAWLQHS